MITPQRWTGHEARLLRAALRLSLRGFAAHLGVAERTVSKWEKAGRSTTPWPESQAILDTALLRAGPDVQARFTAMCGSDMSGMKPSAGPHPASTAVDLPAVAVESGELDLGMLQVFVAEQRHRRVTRQLVVAHQGMEQAIAVLYRSADPHDVLPTVISYADHLAELLHLPMADRDHIDLAAVAIGVHAQVGLWACHAHRPGVAQHYLSAAQDMAAATGDRHLQACALGALSYLYSSAPRGGFGGNPGYALSLLDQALELATHTDGFTKGWLATWRADQYSTLGNLPAAGADIDVAEAGLAVNDDSSPEGFFGRQTYGYGMMGHLGSVQAVMLAVAGESDAAERTFSQVQADAANVRRRIASYGHEALGHVSVDDPEAACAALERSISMAVEASYAMGLKRAVGVRAGFDPGWLKLPCVALLDERIRRAIA